MKITLRENKNYFFLEKGDKVLEEHKKNVKVLKDYTYSTRYKVLFNDKDILPGGFDWSEATLDGTPFASQSAFEDWIYENTGFNTASGGSGAGSVNSVTGDGVDNTDPEKPVLTFPTLQEVTDKGNTTDNDIYLLGSQLSTKEVGGNERSLNLGYDGFSISEGSGINSVTISQAIKLPETGLNTETLATQEWVNANAGDDLQLGETNTTAYRGDRGKTAYDHSQEVTGNPHNVTKNQVGLSNVNNTSDLAKPISTATQNALDDKTDNTDFTDHTSDQLNPHNVTKAQVGLSNVDNTSDLDKPVSTAQAAANTVIQNDVDEKVYSKTTNEPLGSDKVVNMVSLTQAEYDAGTPNPQTFYIITDA